MAKISKSKQDAAAEAVIIAIFVVSFVLGAIAFGAWLYALIVYGNTPAAQLPTWAWWILQKGGGQ